ncbi:serine hydrolase-domain-containing protein [Aspergillus oleicola]
MPKILALHGYGTSASIFKSQTETAAFRSKLPSSYTFDFLNAPYPSPPAPGIKAIYPDHDTFTWYRENTPAGLREAHARVLQYCANHGPFDAVMGFSQGCSLLASLVLFRSFEGEYKLTGRGTSNEINGIGNGCMNGGREQNGTVVEGELPFKSAIFICGGIPLYALSDLGLPITDAAEAINKESGLLLNNTAGSLNTFAKDTSQIKRGIGLWDKNLSSNALLHDPRMRPDRSNVFGLDFTSFPKWAIIDIPTVHIYGGKDPRWPAGIQLAEFCESNKREEFDHGGGHDIPRTSEVSVRIAGLNYTDPKLREEVKNEIQGGEKGGKPGQWSARKAQMTASEYKARGGDYTTSKDEKQPQQKNLDKWGAEEWQTKEGSGTAKEDDGTRKRYLPKKAWEEMSKEEKEETENKKKAGSKRGKQFVGNTDKARRKRREVSKGEAAKGEGKENEIDGEEKEEEEDEDEVEEGDEEGDEEEEEEGSDEEECEEDEGDEDAEEDEQGEEGDDKVDGEEDGRGGNMGESGSKQPEKKRQKKN